MKFIIASNNPHKITELSRILTRLGIEAASPRELGLSLGEVEETGSTFAENARIKAEHAERLSGLPAIADDSGLAVDALGGAPGIYSARYAGENATDSERMDKLLGELKDVDAPRRGAKFVSAICVCFSPGRFLEVEGECQGAIAFEKQGEGGFGYDPLFLCEGRSFAQMSAAEKDEVSHRGRALRRLEEALRDYLEEHPEISG